MQFCPLGFCTKLEKIIICIPANYCSNLTVYSDIIIFIGNLLLANRFNAACGVRPSFNISIAEEADFIFESHLAHGETTDDHQQHVGSLFRQAGRQGIADHPANQLSLASKLTLTTGYNCRSC